MTVLFTQCRREMKKKEEKKGEEIYGRGWGRDGEMDIIIIIICSSIVIV